MYVHTVSPIIDSGYDGTSIVEDNRTVLIFELSLENPHTFLDAVVAAAARRMIAVAGPVPVRS